MSDRYHKPDKVIIDDPAARYLDLEAIDRELWDGIVTGLPSPSAATEPITVDDLRRAIELVERQYERELIPARIEVSYLALFAIRSAAPVVESPPDSLAALTELPIVVKANLPPGAWRVLDRNGSVMREGTVAT